jgi:hypothetical protein
MTETDAQSYLSELDNLRRKTRTWRVGTQLLILCGLIACIAILRDSVYGLVSSGPRQTAFEQALRERLKQRTLPAAQTIALAALTKSRPQIDQVFANSGERLPELTGSALGELQTFQQNVAARSQASVAAALLPLIAAKEQTIRQLAPGAPDASVQTLMAALQEEGKRRAGTITTHILARHMDAVNTVFRDLGAIRHTEPALDREPAPHWETADVALSVVPDAVKQIEDSDSFPIAAQPVAPKEIRP